MAKLGETRPLKTKLAKTQEKECGTSLFYAIKLTNSNHFSVLVHCVVDDVRKFYLVTAKQLHIIGQYIGLHFLFSQIAHAHNKLDSNVTMQ